jgi:hypothetical protein
MHTEDEPGINLKLAEDLERTFTWAPPFADSGNAANPSGIEPVGGLGTIILEEIEEAYAQLDKTLQTDGLDSDVDGREVLEGKVYNFDELDRIDSGESPAAESEELNIVGSGARSAWSISSIINK